MMAVLNKITKRKKKKKEQWKEGQNTPAATKSRAMAVCSAFETSSKSNRHRWGGQGEKIYKL